MNAFVIPTAVEGSAVAFRNFFSHTNAPTIPIKLALDVQLATDYLNDDLL